MGAPFSRSQARADGERMLQLYSREGYVNARVDFSVVELPRKGDEEQIRLIYTISNEGDKVYINRIVIGGLTGSAQTRETQREANLRCIPIAEGDLPPLDRIADR